MPRRTPVPTGRPRVEPTPADVRNIEKWASDGCAIIEIARALQISTSLLTRWRKEHPNVDEALEAGKAVEHRALRSEAMKIALSRSAKLDVRVKADMIKFLLLTRHGYRDRGDEQGLLSAGVRVNITLPGAMPLATFLDNDSSARTQRLPDAPAATARGG